MFDSQAFLQHLPARPGVYCMRDAAANVLYVGKAKNLKNRLTSYFRTLLDPRIQQMVSKIANIDITVTYSEKEALLLESSLIKSLKPRYNVIFRDDKSYPYLFISGDEYPRLVYFRGKQKTKGTYFGPYPSAIAVKETLTILQKLFKLRQCDNQFFSHRSRPCLQYQIQRCTAPCVGYVCAKDYAAQVENVLLFLQGKTTTILDNLVQKMEKASEKQNFELAASLRDQILSLRTVQDQQSVQHHKGDIDVIATAELKGHFCLQLLYIRKGQILDSQTFFPKQVGDGDISHILRSFLVQFYLDQENKVDYPGEIILNEKIEDQKLIADSLSQMAKHKILITHPERGNKLKWLTLAIENATQALSRKTANLNVLSQKWLDLKKVFGMNEALRKIECFDVSHLHSEATIASCVVFDDTGPLKSEYRRYNLEVAPHDDYAAMEQVLLKRYSKFKALDLPMPDLILIDGGKGQLHRAKKVMLECQILDVLLVGIAKGAQRKPGLETLYVTRTQQDEESIIKLPPTSSALHLLQHIRDEAHRFAVTGNRQKSRKTRKQSPLESIPGIGEKRRQKLLNYFGGQQALMGASIEAIAQIPGISKALAIKIYEALHSN